MCRLNRERKSAVAKGKAKARKGKARAVEQDYEDDEEQVAEGKEPAEEEGEEELDVGDADEASPSEVAPPQQGTKTTYLDDAVFADAAAQYDLAGQAAGQGEGKKAAKRRVKEERRRRREEEERRAGEVGVGGRTQVGCAGPFSLAP